jgi:hypothetical protein
MSVCVKILMKTKDVFNINCDVHYHLTNFKIKNLTRTWRNKKNLLMEQTKVVFGSIVYSGISVLNLLLLFRLA